MRSSDELLGSVNSIHLLARARCDMRAGVYTTLHGDWWSSCLLSRMPAKDALARLYSLLCGPTPDNETTDTLPQGPRARAMLMQRGFSGGTVLHFCILQTGLHAGDNTNMFDRCEQLAVWLIESYGPGSCFDLVNAQYHIHKHEHEKEEAEPCNRPNCLHWDQDNSAYEGETALHLAIAFNCHRLVQILLSNGARMDLRAR